MASCLIVAVAITITIYIYISVTEKSISGIRTGGHCIAKNVGRRLGSTFILTILVHLISRHVT